MTDPQQQTLEQLELKLQLLKNQIQEIETAFLQYEAFREKAIEENGEEAGEDIAATHRINLNVKRNALVAKQRGIKTIVDQARRKDFNIQLLKEVFERTRGKQELDDLRERIRKHLRDRYTVYVFDNPPERKKP